MKRRWRQIVRDAAAAVSGRRSFSPTRHPYESTNIILISGAPRSGTTALRNSLAAHCDVYSTNCESNVVNDVLCAALRNCTLPDRKGNMVLGQRAYDRIFRRMLLKLLWPNPWDRPGVPRALSTYTHLEPASAEYLVQVFRRARIVYLVRNGIESVASAAAFESFASLPFAVLCKRWAVSLKMAQWGNGRGEFLLVRHEHVRDPQRGEPTLREILHWAGLPYDERCVEVLRSTRFHPTRLPDETDVDAQSLDRRAERWRYWSREQRKTFVDICGPAMNYFGYPIAWTLNAAGDAAHEAAA